MHEKHGHTGGTQKSCGRFLCHLQISVKEIEDGSHKEQEADDSILRENLQIGVVGSNRIVSPFNDGRHKHLVVCQTDPCQRILEEEQYSRKICSRPGFNCKGID